MPASVVALLRGGHAERIGQRSPHSTSPLYVANQWLASEARELRTAHIQRAFDEETIRAYAENYSRVCARLGSLESRRSFARWVGIEPPAGRHLTPDGAAARLDDPLWWRRQLRKRWTRAAENSMRALGVIRKAREPYASNEAVRHRRAQKRRGREFLESSVAVNEAGEQLSLVELADRSIANPSIRRGEFMTRVRGFEEIARDLGHVAEFVTLTCPSYFHAQLVKGGRNPLWQRSVVRDAQAWLCKQWPRARAKHTRLSVILYGFRIAEPHHDATPHWHLLAFVPAHAVGTVRAVVRGCWLSEHADESGAATHRVRFETIDPKAGSAAGYVAKYVSKNIDGGGAIGEETDLETGERIIEGVARVDAWASIHGIRQFQQVGGVPVGLWREARRLRDPAQDRDIERARAAADAGDWRAFSYAASNDSVPSRRTALKLETSETCEVNRYNEARPARIVGLRYAGAVAYTRPYRWRIERRQSHPATRASSPACREARRIESGSASCSSIFSSLGPVAITVRAPAAGDPVVWSNPRETSQAGPQ
jgi:hypothetical protein